MLRKSRASAKDGIQLSFIWQENAFTDGALYSSLMIYHTLRSMPRRLVQIKQLITLQNNWQESRSV